MDIKTIILDFDGVLVESVGIKDGAFEILFKNFPLHLSEIMRYHRTHNATIRFEKFQYIYERILKREYSKELAAQLSEEFSRIVFQKVVACPGVPGDLEFLDYFNHRVPLYLATINPAEELERIIEGRNLQHFFKDVYTYPWRKVDALRNILKTENVRCDQAVFIGDSPEDYQAAQEAGVFFIGRFSDKLFHSVGKYKTFLTARKLFPTQPQLPIKNLDVAGTVPPSSKYFEGKAGQQRRCDERSEELSCGIDAPVCRDLYEAKVLLCTLEGENRCPTI